MSERKWTTLGQVVYDMVQEKKTQTEAFQNFLKYWGREKIKKLYFEEKAKRESEIKKQISFPTFEQDGREDPWEALGHRR